MARMKREAQFERSAMKGIAELRREVNWDSIIFLLLLDTKQKVVPGFSELQIFGYLLSSSFFVLYCPSIFF